MDQAEAEEIIKAEVVVQKLNQEDKENKMRCKICGEERDSCQMKTKDMCNICAYNKNAIEDLKRTYKKFDEAIKL